MATRFDSSRCERKNKEIVDLIKKSYDEVRTMNEFWYLGNSLNATGGCEVAVTARARVGWVIFKKCWELFLGNTFSPKMKG